MSLCEELKHVFCLYFVCEEINFLSDYTDCFVLVYIFNLCRNCKDPCHFHRSDCYEYTFQCKCVFCFQGFGVVYVVFSHTGVVNKVLDHDFESTLRFEHDHMLQPTGLESNKNRIEINLFWHMWQKGRIMTLSKAVILSVHGRLDNSNKQLWYTMNQLKEIVICINNLLFLFIQRVDGWKLNGFKHV